MRPLEGRNVVSNMFPHLVAAGHQHSRSWFSSLYTCGDLAENVAGVQRLAQQLIRMLGITTMCQLLSLCHLRLVRLLLKISC